MHRNISKRNNKLKRKRIKKSPIVTLVLVVAFLLFSFLLVDGVRLVKANKGYEEEIESLIKERDSELLKSEFINNYEEYTLSDEYINDMGREKLGLISPGDIVFKK